MVQNTTQQDPQVHDRAIRDMFADIAKVYDRMNGLLSLGRDARWREDLADAIDPSAEVLLDACSGTGELILTAKARGKGRRHVAMDFCVPMLQAGMRDHGLGRQVSVAAADTQRLPVPDGSFDAAMVAFGLRNLGELGRGLAELGRVLRPGGQLLVLEFFQPQRRWVSAPMNWYLRRGVPLVGRVFGHQQAYRYLPQSMGRFQTLEGFCSMLKAAGFRPEIEVRSQTLGVAHLVVARKAGLEG